MDDKTAKLVETIVDDIKKRNQEKQENKTSDITLEMATKLIAQIEDKARTMGLSVVVAVSNKAARPVAIHCMDDAYIASFDVALNKAYTVVALKMSTTKLKTLAQPGSDLYGIQFTNEGKIVIFGGGVPLYLGKNLIGGLGVSGGSEEQDSALAQYGEDLVKEGTIWQ